MTEQSANGFARVAGIDTHAATPATVAHDNIKVNTKRDLPRFSSLPGFNKRKRKDQPIALIGGGPSLRETFHELKNFDRSIACGSVHDFLTSNDYYPEFAACCDPDPISRAYFQHPSTKVTYLLASICEPELFDHLAGHRIYLWHSFSSEPSWREVIDEAEGAEWHAVAGGCTVGLRALSMAIMLGFSNIHFFGFDSCVKQVSINDNTGSYRHHAYAFATDQEKMQDVHVIRAGVDAPGDEVFYCEGYQLAQAYHFKMFVTQHGHLFDATFHGGGLLATYYESYKEGVRKAVDALTPEKREEYFLGLKEFEHQELVA